MFRLSIGLTAVLFVSSLLAADESLPPYRPHAVELPRNAPYLTPTGAIGIVGYNDMAEMIAAFDARFSETHPGVTFVPVLKGTRTGPPALAAGTSALAPMGAEFSAAELAAYRAATGTEPVVFRVAHCSLDPRALSGPIGVFVRRDNPLNSLTLDELAKIFAEGSPALNPCGVKAEAALGLFFRDRALHGRAFAAAFAGFAQSAEVVAHVADDPHAIGFAALNRALADPRMKILALAATTGSVAIAPTRENLQRGLYPLDRFLLIYARAPLDPVVREYLRLVLSREGQEIIAAGSLGYAPLTAGEISAELAKLN